jgi:hypothetical protein
MEPIRIQVAPNTKGLDTKWTVYVFANPFVQRKHPAYSNSEERKEEFDSMYEAFERAIALYTMEKF